MKVSTKAKDLLEFRTKILEQWGQTPPGEISWNGKLSLTGILIAQGDVISNAHLLTTVRNIAEVLFARPVSKWEETAKMTEVIALLDTTLFALKSGFMKEVDTFNAGDKKSTGAIQRIRAKYAELLAEAA